MIIRRLVWIFIYLGTGCVAIVAAFFLTTHFLTSAYSQTPTKIEGMAPPDPALAPPSNSLPPPSQGAPPPNGQGQGLPPPPNPHVENSANLPLPGNLPPQPPAQVDIPPAQMKEPQGRDDVQPNPDKAANVYDLDSNVLDINAIRKEGWIYDGRGRRDPFVPYQKAMPINSTERSTIFLEDLQRYELKDLRLIGILWDIKKPKAMILDPKGKVNVVQKGSRIGLNGGYVAVIREGEVVVVEPYRDPAGGETFTTRIMSIIE